MRQILATAATVFAASLLLQGASAGQAPASVAYVCAAGRQVRVIYGPGWADVAFGARSSRLNLLVSRGPRRYGDGRWLWQTTGPGAMLTSEGRVVAADCLPRQRHSFVPVRARYTCTNGLRVDAVYRDNAAEITFGGRRYAMYQSMAADGVRYAGAGLVWWTRGRGAFLSKSDGRMIARSCHTSSL